MFPLYRVLHGTYNGTEVYVLQQGDGTYWFPARISNPNNFPQYQYAYVVGSGAAGSHTYPTAAAALAAVTADYNGLIAARNQPVAGSLVALPDSPVLGPG